MPPCAHHFFLARKTGGFLRGILLNSWCYSSRLCQVYGTEANGCNDHYPNGSAHGSNEGTKQQRRSPNASIDSGLRVVHLSPTAGSGLRRACESAELRRSTRESDNLCCSRTPHGIMW